MVRNLRKLSIRGGETQGRQMNDNDDFSDESEGRRESPGEVERKAARKPKIPAFLFDRSVSPEVGSAIRKLEEKRRDRRGW